MTDSSDLSATQAKVGELLDAIKDLTYETKRLKGNLDKLNKMQELLYTVNKQCVEQLEADNKESPSDPLPIESGNLTDTQKQVNEKITTGIPPEINYGSRK